MGKERGVGSGEGGRERDLTRYKNIMQHKNNIDKIMILRQ